MVNSADELAPSALALTCPPALRSSLLILPPLKTLRERHPLPQNQSPSLPKPQTPALPTAAHLHQTEPEQEAARISKRKRCNYSCVLPRITEKHLQNCCKCSNNLTKFLQQHFVSEWVGEKQQDHAAVRTPEPAPERPLRISSDPEVLATQLNALPGMACSQQVYSTPKHYVRFSSPFLVNRSPTTPGVPTGRRRSRELPDALPTTGSCKKV